MSMSFSQARTPVTSRESMRHSFGGGGDAGSATSPSGMRGGIGGMTPKTYYSPPPATASTSSSAIHAGGFPQSHGRQSMGGMGMGARGSSASGFGSSQQQSSPAGGGVPQQSPDQDVIDHASRVMDRLMNKDLTIPSLYRTLSTSGDPNLTVTGHRPVSGFMEFDYPAFVERHVVTEKQYSMAYSTPIPAELNEMLSQSDAQHYHMGLFPEIYRAWMSIDSDIYLWDFRDGSDLSFFDGLKEPIITIALVPAKKQVFQDSIKHLLCVTTASEIALLGFLISEAVPQGGAPVIELVPQPIFVLPTDGIPFPVIHGTRSGRIFLGGMDGSVHEVNYQAEKGWISDRCWKTNLTRSYFGSIFKFISTSSTADPITQIVSDDVRNFLFARSKSGCLQAFDLDRSGDKFSRLGCITMENLIGDVVALSKKTLENNLLKNILTIAPVTSGEINLVAVLDTGVRLYFSCTDPITGVTAAPTRFGLVHARLPPGFCTSSAMPKPSIAHTAFYSQGLLALAAKASHENDSFWLISPFIFPSTVSSEVFSVQAISGQTLEIKQIPTEPRDNALDHLPDVITQHLNWTKDIVVLTSNGTSVLRVSKPYEVLKNLLIEYGATDNLKNHFDSASREQPLANTILLTVHPTTRSEASILSMAVKAFFLHGGDSASELGWTDGRLNSPFETTMDFNPNVVSTPRQEANLRSSSPYSPGFRDSGFTSPQLAGGGHMAVPYSSSGDLPQYPARHDALYLVVGRILFNFWNRPLVNIVQPANPGTGTPPVITPNVHGHEVTRAITFLQNILQFINNNPSLYMSRSNVSTAMINLNTPEGRQLYAQEIEKNSIIALKEFLYLTLEVLNMWKILCDHQFHIVLQGVDNQHQLQNSTMRDLVISGHSTVSVIINALISKYLGDNAAVDTISMRLREVCPTLFKSEDAIGSKVAEILSKVKSSNDVQEKDLLLKESLVLSEKICGHGRVNIRNLCKQYSDLGFPVGAVKLCVSAAKAADPDKLALESVKSISPSTDAVGLQAYQARAEIYRIVFDLLDGYVQLASNSQSPILRGMDDRVSPQTAQLCTEETIHAILTSDDEMFHISLYNWLLEKKQFDRLLEIKHPYLDSFLQRAADAVVSGKWSGGGVSANDTRVLDLLWRHHEMNQNHVAAAHILAKLAESTTTGLNLQQRLEYMSRAIICSKTSSRRGDMLEQLEDKVEVAQIQKNILDAVSYRMNRLLSSPGEDDSEVKLLQEAAHRLNSQLFSITTLYTDYACPLKLNEAKLEIFYSAAHGDKLMIESVWSDIIEEELALSGPCSSEAQMEVIRRKIVFLGKKYITSPVFFPIEYLIEHLEMMKPQDAENVTWVFDMMLKVGVNFQDVLLIYERLWRKGQSRPSGSGPGSDVSYAKVVVLMVDALTKQDGNIRVALANRPDLLERCKDLLSNMVVEYSSRFDQASSEVTHMLNRVRERLDRVGAFM